MEYQGMWPRLAPYLRRATESIELDRDASPETVRVKIYHRCRCKGALRVRWVSGVHRVTCLKCHRKMGDIVSKEPLTVKDLERLARTLRNAEEVII